MFRIGSRLRLGETLALTSKALSGTDWIPTTLSGCDFWVDPTDSSTLYKDTGATTICEYGHDPIGYVRDKSGNAKHLTQGTAANQPKISPFGIGGKPAFAFMGGQWLTQASFTAGATCTWFLVIRKNIASQNELFYLDNASLSSNRQSFVDSGAKYLFSAGTSVSNGTTTSENDPHVVCIVFNGASSVVYIDGVSTVTGNPGTNTMTGIRLGSRYDGTLPLEGWIGEVIHYNRVLSAGERDQVTSYLTQKWVNTSATKERMIVVDPGGNDGANGALATPKRNVVVNAGDGSGFTYLLKTGPYNNTVSWKFDNSNPETGPSSLISYPGASSLTINAGSVGGSKDAIIIGGKNVFIRDIAISNSQSRGVSVYGTSWRNVSLNNISVVGSYQGGLVFENTSGKGRWCGATIVNCSVRNACNNSSTNGVSTWSSGIVFIELDGFICKNNTVYETWGEGINALRSRYGLIEGNTVYDCMSVNLYVEGGAEIQIARNRSYNTGNTQFYRDNRRESPPSSGTWIGDTPASCCTIGGERSDSWPTTGIYVRNNVLAKGVRAVKIQDYGVMSDPSYKNIWIEGNSISDITDRSLQMFTHPNNVGNTFRWNSVYNCAQAPDRLPDGFTVGLNNWKLASAGPLATPTDTSTTPAWAGSDPTAIPIP